MASPEKSSTDARCLLCPPFGDLSAVGRGFTPAANHRTPTAGVNPRPTCSRIKTPSSAHCRGGICVFFSLFHRKGL